MDTRKTGLAATRRRVVVTGEVQGVFFRDTCRRTALQYQVAGWVRNLPDGSVEAVFEGEPHHVALLVEWAGQGPPAATVRQVSVVDEEAEGLEGFEVR
ncbi:acylphosphatase [Streptomyces luteolus]|uniref:Acylphosphatase n=1 Tax=Streptomyces luteolus TaxID=3043615 RepID=A0ABT6T645_9ACTN|nr:acylphosphatase [Streptomyces sp. B-S-A12]MDI3422843.1 acylphosphatase [Streptomyces sp. B-S-A12]